MFLITLMVNLVPIVIKNEYYTMNEGHVNTNIGGKYSAQLS